MPLDAYAPCPCGSGKKFKWCCQPIQPGIDQAFEQFSNGQQEAALVSMEAVAREHSGNPEAHGRHAQMLALVGRVEDAEAALQKAFAINPNYPFGHLLRGTFRMQEGETVGALLLFRKAAELYAPESHDVLGTLHEQIFEAEMRRNRPVAARAALERATRYLPAEEELRRGLESVFGASSRLPLAARRAYTFRSPPQADAVWTQALTQATTGRLVDALKAFQSLTQHDATNAAAWYNLALCQAWLGDNADAIESLDRYVALETDETAVADAWALAEVLRCGAGLEGQADCVEYRRGIRFRDPRAVEAVLRKWTESHRAVGLQSPQQGVLTGLILEEVTSLALAGNTPLVAPLAAHLLILGDVIRLTSNREAVLDKVADEVARAIGAVSSDIRKDVGPAPLGDVISEAMSFPTRPATPLEVEGKMREHARRFFEEVWLHRPLRSLNGVTPIDAAGHPTLARKLRGVIQFLEQCMDGATPRDTEQPMSLYDFNRLRHKLGLGGPVPSEASPLRAPVEEGPDFDAMNAAELAEVGVATLSDVQLEAAFRAALKLDAREVASRFARTLVARPPSQDHPDRYAAYTHLIQQAMAENNVAEALKRLDEAEQADTEHNAGKRCKDYRLRRAQVHARSGNTAAAAALYDQLIAEEPNETRYRGSAAEAMLGQRNKSLALTYAEGGLAKAREQNNRDSEEYFLELVSAAQRL